MHATRDAKGALLIAVMFCVAATLSVHSKVNAETYPNRDITYINPFNPGGSTDPLSRQYVKQLEKILGCNVIVENKPGGSGTIGASVVVRSRPDGYTIGYASTSIIGYQPLIHKNLPLNTPEDYQCIVKMIDQPAVLVVRSDAPWKTFEEFMTYVKKNPGKIRFGTSGLRTIPDLVMNQLMMATGVDVRVAPFTGGAGEAVIALVGGRIESAVAFTTGILGQIQAGKIRPLAVFKRGRYDLLPNATPVFEAGYDATLQSGGYVIGPKGMPKEVLDKLVASSLQVVRSEEFRKFCDLYGFVPDAKGPEELKKEVFEYQKDFVKLINFIEKRK
jgi:tripartite-type tricarboxylate transporter receptor subunit TctC